MAAAAHEFESILDWWILVLGKCGGTLASLLSFAMCSEGSYFHGLLIDLIFVLEQLTEIGSQTSF